MTENPTSTAAPRIDLYSDTITKPSPGMRRAMVEAEVGNEQAMEDPTVNRLCAMTTELLGKEAAMFLPSGTMCNEIAYRVWCDHGDEILLDETSHALHFEVGGPAALAGAMCRTVSGKRGMFTADEVEEKIRRPHGHHTQRTALVSVENTANVGGGAVWPIEQLRSVAEASRAHGARVHMDGARLMNAVVASGTSARDYAEAVDSVWVDLSKGLGCPVGAVLAGSADFINKAWRFKHQFGGAMRQAGIIAAAGVFAFEHNVERLAEDHANARRFAEGLATIEGISVNANEIDTNMVYFEVAGLGMSAADFSARLAAEHGVRIGAFGATTLRAVTHLDVDANMIDQAVIACRVAAI